MVQLRRWYIENWKPNGINFQFGDDGANDDDDDDSEESDDEVIKFVQQLDQ